MADAMQRLIELLRQLPGVGEKTAARLMFAILSANKDYGRALSAAVSDVVERVHPCSTCGNLTEVSPCDICSDTRRDGHLICVVERVPDLRAIESTHEFSGLYHVLGGVLSPLDGTGPEGLRIEALLERVRTGVTEVILAIGSSVEGEATALYLKKRLQPLGVRLTRIAAGIPVGGELEYVDASTIGRALTGRRDMG